jgi:small subunit ribosomal protein S20
LSKGAEKAVQVAERRRRRNRSVRRTIKTYVSNAESQISAGDEEGAKTTMQQAISTLDKAARRGVIHRNNAARRKSRLMKQFNQLSA